MKLFLDTSVILAACGSADGASRYVVETAAMSGWTLLTSSYVVSEVEANIKKLPEAAATHLSVIKTSLSPVANVLSFDWASVVSPTKDRPILFTAAAWADVLLTLDRRDFIDRLGGDFYGLPLMTPAAFLWRARDAGRLR